MEVVQHFFAVMIWGHIYQTSQVYYIDYTSDKVQKIEVLQKFLQEAFQSIII